MLSSDIPYSIRRHIIPFFGAAVLLLSLAGSAYSQTNNSYPMLMSIRPAAACVGASTEHELSARYNLAGALSVIVSGTGVTAELLPNEAEKPEDKDRNDVMSSKCKLRFTCAPDAVPGIRDFRVMTPHGVSTIGQIVVVREPVVSEAADNDVLEKAQAITLPATLCGAIEKGEDLDFFKFHVDQPTAITFHMVSQRLQNRLHDMQTRVDPMITLRNDMGSTLASSDNHYAGDPLLHYPIDRPGDYVLEVRDVRYQGNADWTYSIECSTRPFVTMVRPLVLAANGTPSAVQLLGLGIPANSQQTMQLSADSDGRMVRVSTELSGQPLQSVLVVGTSSPIVPEVAVPVASPTATDGTTSSLATSITPFTVPAVLSGALDKSSESDRFQFEAKAQEKFTFEVLARRLGSSLDPKLRVLNEQGAALSEVDDMTFDRVMSSDAMLENWVAPADGKYTLEIKDLHGRGGVDFPYAVRVTRAEPYFLVEADTDKTELAPAMASVIYVKALRRNGFAGEIQLAIEGLPPGVTAVAGRILNGRPDGAIWLSASPDAAIGVSNVKITGTSMIDQADGSKKPMVAMASNMQEVYMPGGGRGHYPVEMHTVSIAKPMDVRKVSLSTTQIELKPGGSQRIDITVERAPDYKGNVTLDVMLQHLEQPYGNPLPAGVTVDVGASKTLLTGAESAGYITLKAAADAPLVEKHLVPITVHVSINFVMKHTFTGDPVYVTVK
jgi:hypothetical protein